MHNTSGTKMGVPELLYRTRKRLARHSVYDHLRGLLFSRKMTKHGIIVVSGDKPFPKIVNDGGEIIAENCQFYEGTRLEVGRGALIRIGNGTIINRNTLVVARERVEIGRECRIAWDVIIMDSDLHPVQGRPMRNMPVIIEDHVWICFRSIILKGVRIGRGAVVAAGSVVTKDVPPYALAAGVPATIISQRMFENEKVQEEKKNEIPRDMNEVLPQDEDRLRSALVDWSEFQGIEPVLREESL